MGARQGDFQRRTIGLCVDPLQRRLLLAAVDVRGPCLSGKLVHMGGSTVALPDDLQRDLATALNNTPQPAPELAHVSARLAEVEAEALHKFLRSPAATAQSDAEPLLIAVCDPCLWNAAGRPWQSVFALGDPARLAELTDLNVLDSCEARHATAGGDAATGDNLAVWLLLHSPKRDRVYLDWGPQLRVVSLPAGCESSAAGRTAVRTIQVPQGRITDPIRWSDLAWQTVDVLSRLVPRSPNPLQLLVRAPEDAAGRLVEEITRIAPFTEPLDWRHVRVDPEWLDAAVAAAMAHLFLDHVPQAGTAADDTNSPRLLGRLTPGSLMHWHRLMEHLAARLPESIPLRAAI